MTGEIQRYRVRERLVHWVTGIAYLYCFATGLAFFTPHFFWLAQVLGGGPTSRFWHPILGVVFLIAMLWMRTLWRADLKTTTVDKQWEAGIKNYMTNRDQLLPPQERFNAGQKQFFWLMFWSTFFLLVSGLFMWFPEYIPKQAMWIRPLMVLIHEVAALLTIGGFIVHVYMGIFVVPGSMTAITTGYVSRAWARTHHLLWYRRVAGE